VSDVACSGPPHITHLIPISRVVPAVQDASYIGRRWSVGVQDTRTYVTSHSTQDRRAMESNGSSRIDNLPQQATVIADATDGEVFHNVNNIEDVRESLCKALRG